LTIEYVKLTNKNPQQETKTMPKDTGYSVSVNDKSLSANTPSGSANAEGKMKGIKGYMPAGGNPHGMGWHGGGGKDQSKPETVDYSDPQDMKPDF